MIDIFSAKHKHIAVFGLGKAGMATVHALADSGAMLHVWDDGEASRQKLSAEGRTNVRIAEPATYDWTQIEYLVLSPGIPLTHPKPHPVVLLAAAAGKPVICDIELLWRSDPKATFVGITGTNGKSTTTALLGHILKEAGLKTAVGGNIGVPVLELDAVGAGGVYVIEMSSYQLDLIEDTHFNLSVWLNITPDHIDRHGDLVGYVNAKKHIYDRQGKSDVAVIGVDDSYSLKVYQDLKNKGLIGTVIPVSVEKKLSDGISAIGGAISDDASGKTPLALGELKRLPGAHNAQNIAAAYAVASRLGVADDVILAAVKSFAGLPHRMQYIAEMNGVRFINDSKATNAEAASKALGTFDNIYWIAGGVPKEGGIDPLQRYFSKIRKAYLIGQAEDDFAKTLEGKVAYKKCKTLAAAFEAARKDALAAGAGIVLLSPACASFDQWPNFEVRGEAFCGMVKEVESNS